MKFTLCCFVALSFISFSQRTFDKHRIIDKSMVFENGSIEKMYGDNVVLRKKPNTESIALDTLNISDEVKILEKTNDLIQINRLESNWYKVRYGRKIGFIPGGFIACDSKRIGDDLYLVIMSGGSDEYNIKVRTRVLNKNGEFYGKEVDINTPVFYIETFDNRELDKLKNMLRINLFAEACGVDGGEVYLFNTGDRIIEAIQLSRVSDGGVFWFSEELIFPDEPEGGWKVIKYKRTYGEPKNEEMLWNRSTVDEIYIQWDGEKLTPNVQEFDFGDE